MAHISVPEAEEYLDKEIPVLDKGFLRLVDYMGGDARVVAAARVSYGGGTKSFREDRALIRYLMSHGHTSPFEQVILTVHAKMPIFVARQWIRHRTARINEISGRYSVMREEFYMPEAPQVRFQSQVNRQGSSEEDVPAEVCEKAIKTLADGQADAYKGYQEMIGAGIARELARINLPLSLYTEWYWQIDLHNLFHFLNLRLDPHAQVEIRAYAEILMKFARAVAPVSAEAFEEYVMRGVTLSPGEASWLAEKFRGADLPPELAEKLRLKAAPPTVEPEGES